MIITWLNLKRKTVITLWLSVESKNHRFKELEQENLRFIEKMNTHLEKMDKKNTEILDTFNQDTKTPLVIIKSYTDMLLEDKFGPINEIQREKLMRMKESIESLINAIFETAEKKQVP